MSLNNPFSNFDTNIASPIPPWLKTQTVIPNTNMPSRSLHCVHFSSRNFSFLTAFFSSSIVLKSLRRCSNSGRTRATQSKMPCERSITSWMIRSLSLVGFPLGAPSCIFVASSEALVSLQKYPFSVRVSLMIRKRSWRVCSCSSINGEPSKVRL
ncbi:hypothetical protein BDV19DRAFT_354022, partial [Aspergillus venezuelensis]